MKFPFIKMNIIQYIYVNKEMTGYSFMKYCKERGINVSSGTIYPHLKELEDLGMITHRKDGKRKIYTITKDGKLWLEKLSKNDIPKILQGFVEKFYKSIFTTIWNDKDSILKLKNSLSELQKGIDNYIDYLDKKEDKN